MATRSPRAAYASPPCSILTTTLLALLTRLRHQSPPKGMDPSSSGSTLNPSGGRSESLALKSQDMVTQYSASTVAPTYSIGVGIFAEWRVFLTSQWSVLAPGNSDEDSDREGLNRKAAATRAGKIGAKRRAA